LTEGVVLALLGGALAIVVCVWCLQMIEPLVPDALIPNGLHVDRLTLGFGVLMALVTGLLCGSLPALLVARRNPQASLASHSRSSTAGADDTRMRGILIAAEVALALVLLIGAGLLARSFVRLLHVDTGLQADRVAVADFQVPRFMYADHAARGPLYQRMLDATRAIPGVESAAIVTYAPFTTYAAGGTSWFTREGRPAARPEELIARNRLVSADYFQTLGVPLRAGRLFDARDDERSTPVAIVNDVMARRFWPGDDAVGKRFKFGLEDSTNPWITIVGVVGDARQHALTGAGTPEISRPYQQDTQNWLAPQSLVVRTAGDPRAQLAAVRGAILAADRLLPIRALQPMSALLAASVATRRLYLLLMGGFASVALLLAAIGIYGVVAYTATQRTREMGIRVALGAHRGDVVRLMLRQGFPPVVIGAIAGLGLAALASRVLTTLLFEVKPGDVLTFVAVPVVMLAAAAVAAYIPARRASRVDPIVALRHD
jgi:putative ABC transport system permease protein